MSGGRISRRVVAAKRFIELFLIGPRGRSAYLAHGITMVTKYRNRAYLGPNHTYDIKCNVKEYKMSALRDKGKVIDGADESSQVLFIVVLRKDIEVRGAYGVINIDIVCIFIHPTSANCSSAVSSP